MADESILPVTAKLGRTEYTLARERPGMLVLRRDNSDGITEIYFPDSLIVEIVRKVVHRHMVHRAGVEVARMFGLGEPPQPPPFEVE